MWRDRTITHCGKRSHHHTLYCGITAVLSKEIDEFLLLHKQVRMQDNALAALWCDSYCGITVVLMH